MIQFKTKNSGSRGLAATMSKLFRFIEKEGLMASLVISDGKHVETHLAIDPDWSCIHASRRGTADVHVKVQTWKGAYDSAATRDGAIDRSVTGLALTFEAVQEQIAWLMAVMTDLQNARKFAAFGEEWQGRTSEPPDPDKYPESIEEAADVIFGCLTEDQIAWVKVTPLYDALLKVDGQFGTGLIEHWCGKFLGALVKHVRNRFKLFGHPEDCKILILTALWGLIREESPERIESNILAEVSGIQKYWQTEGRNPETGERSLTVAGT